MCLKNDPFLWGRLISEQVAISPAPEFKVFPFVWSAPSLPRPKKELHVAADYGSSPRPCYRQVKLWNTSSTTLSKTATDFELLLHCFHPASHKFFAPASLRSSLKQFRKIRPGSGLPQVIQLYAHQLLLPIDMSSGRKTCAIHFCNEEKNPTSLSRSKTQCCRYEP